MPSQPILLTGKTQLVRRKTWTKLLSVQGRELPIQKVLFRNRSSELTLPAVGHHPAAAQGLQSL